MIEASRPDTHMTTVPSVRTTCHTFRTPVRPSIIRPDNVHFRSDPPLCREVSIQLASVRTTQQHVRTPLGTRPVSDSFQVPIKEISINRPDDVVSRSDARLLKVRIAIQISLSGRQLALVRMRVQLIWKLPIRLQPSGRLLSWSGRAYSRYGNCVLKFSRSDTHSPWSGRMKPYKGITCSGRATVWTMCHLSGRGS
jgi:hypothetical protein